MNEILKKYYDYLKSVKADIPDTYESFATTLKDEVAAEQYYNYLKANQFDAPDTFKSFSETLGLKKKVSLIESLAKGETMLDEYLPKREKPQEPSGEEQPPLVFKKTILPIKEESQFQQWKDTEPENDLYDFRGFYEAEKDAGTLKPSLSDYFKEDPNFHFYSIGKNGRVLKSPNHPTFNKTMEGEKSMGNEVYVDKNGVLRSRKQPPLVSETESIEDIDERIRGLLDNAKIPQNPFLQPADVISVKLPLKPLYIPTVREYLNEKGVTLKDIGLPEDINIDRQLREDEIGGFDELLKAKGLPKLPKPSYFWGAGKEVHYAYAKVFNDIGDAFTTIANLPGLENIGPIQAVGKIIAKPISKFHVFHDVANIIEKRAEEIRPLPANDLGKLIGGGIGLTPLFMEMTISPEFKLGSILGKEINISRFLTQMSGQGFVNRYAAEIEEDKEPTTKAMVEGLKGLGEGALTATIFTKLGYAGGKLGAEVMRATESGVAGALTNATTNSVGFVGYTLAEMIARGEPIDDQKLREYAILGAALTIPAISHFVGKKSIGNYLMSSPAAKDAAEKIEISPEEARKWASNIIGDAQNEPDLIKRGAKEMVGNFVNDLTDVKIISEEIRKDASPFIETIENSDLPSEYKKIFEEEIKTTVAEDVTTPEIDKLNTEIETLKKIVKAVRSNEKIPEVIRKERILPLQEKIANKEAKILELQPKAKEKPTIKEKLAEELTGITEKPEIKEEITPKLETKEEIENAERIRRETEEASRQKEMVEGEEERIRLRNLEEDRLEAKPPEEIIPPPPEIPPPKPTKGKIIPLKVEMPARGIKYKDKVYTDIDQVQDDFDKFKDFSEYNKVLEQVRKYEDNLKIEASKNVSQLDKKLGFLADEVSSKITQNTKDFEELAIRLFPDISKMNTALWKQIIKAKDPALDWVAKQIQAGETNKTGILRWVSKFVTNLYPSMGRTHADIFGTGEKGQIGLAEMKGTAKEYALFEGEILLPKLRAIVNNDAESLRRVRDVSDPDIATEKLTYDDLNDSEKLLYDTTRELNTWLFESNYADGFVPTDTYLKFKDAENKVTYLARLYDKWEGEIDDVIGKGVLGKGTQARTLLNMDIFKARDEINEWKKKHAITDVAYLTTKRVVQTIQNHAIKQYMNQILVEHPDFVRDIKKGEDIPAGFTKLGSSRRWGELRNKAVANHIVEDFTGFFYANRALDTLYDAFKLWDRSKFIQFYKKWHTVYNPIVQLGNFTGNLFFGSIAGVNPVVLAARMPEAKNLPKTNVELYKSLLKSGLMGATGITGDMTPITSQNKNIVNNVTKSQNILKSAVQTLADVDKAATDLYQNADNIAKISAYLIFKDQGLTHQQAVRRVYDSFQNYAMVGKVWDFASKTPLVGNKFIKFQADLQRIIANGLTSSPLTTLGTLGLIWGMGEIASNLSGETDEEKKIRETRKGVAKIPFVDIPLSFKVGKKEINVARYLSPLYLYHYGDNDMDIYEMSRWLPYQIQRMKKAELGEFKPVPTFSDPALGWIPSIIFDYDFRSRSIWNPEATPWSNPSPQGVDRIGKLANVLNYTARSQMPFFRSFDDMANAISGKLDYYGRKRTWTDAILNNIIKIQEFDKPELKDYIEGNINYLTSIYTDWFARMGDANSSFNKNTQKAEEQGLSGRALEKTYETQDKLRWTRISDMEKKIPEIQQELDRLITVYKKWYPNDKFIKENYNNIEDGQLKYFTVLDEADFQNKYKKEYKLLKDNNLFRRPTVIPSVFNGIKLTDEQKKKYMSTYWSWYLRNLDMMVGLTQEDIDEKKEIITSRKYVETEPELVEEALLNELVSQAKQNAEERAKAELRMEILKVKK